jgi:hypothetical protein
MALGLPYRVHAQPRPIDDAALREAIARFNYSVAEAEISIIEIVKRQSLSYRDSATAYGHLAVAEHAARRPEVAKTFLAMALAADPDFELRAIDAPPRLRRDLDSLRAVLPLVRAVDAPSLTFSPFDARGPEIAYRLSGSIRANGRSVRASLEADGKELGLVNERAVGEALVWPTGERTVIPASAPYDLKVAIRDSLTNLTFARRIRVTVASDTPYGRQLDATPQPPSMEPVVRTSIQTVKVRKPLWVLAVALGAASASALASVGSDERACESSNYRNCDSINYNWKYAVGLWGLIGAGWSLLRTKSETRSVVAPDSAALVQNERKQAAYERAMQSATERNRQIRAQTKITVAPARP